MSQAQKRISPLDMLLDVQKDLDDPAQKEFFTRTYIKGENTVSVLKQMQLDDSFVPRMIAGIAKQKEPAKSGGAQ